MKQGSKASKRAESQFMLDMMDVLSAPILTFSQSWASCLPDRLIKIIPQARLIASICKEEYATLPEAVAYIMTATLEFPMHGEWVDIYTHVSCKVCEQYWKEDHWEEVRAPRELDDYRSKMLMRLRVWIYERRRKVVKERLKKMANEDKPVSMPTAEDIKKPQTTTYEQLKFEF